VRIARSKNFNREERKGFAKVAKTSGSKLRARELHRGVGGRPLLLEFSPMAKQHYFFKLLPPRATFPYDITAEEKQLMDEHARYFDEQFAAGRMLPYGPVMAPNGAFGLAVLEVENEGEARQFGDADPSVRAGLNRFEIRPMRVSAARAKDS